MAGWISANCNSEVLQRKLLLRLEKVRTRLAVAIATESKITPPERWQKYRETECRMRRCLKELRAGVHPGRLDSDVCRWALEALDILPCLQDISSTDSEALQLCRRLTEVLEMLERS